jgi:hypothetical protein
MCCLNHPNHPDPGPPVRDTCSSFDGLSCGMYQHYAEILSTCCQWSENTSEPLAVLECDELDIGLTFRRCEDGFGCVEHSGILNKRTGQMGTYAQCEML